jgi:hypothetical protein
VNDSDVRDHLEIMALLTRYAWAIDGKQPGLFGTVFTADISADYGPFGAFTDLATLVTRFDEYHAQFSTTQHVITNANISIDGDAATCRSYFQATMVHESVDTPGASMLTEGRSFRGGGYYEDDLVRTTDGWRITKRSCVGTWFKTEPDLVIPSSQSLSARPH